MIRRGRWVVVATLAALIAGAAPAARAAEQQSYAAALNYATPAVVAAQGDSLRFTNLDSLAQHDVVSDTPGQFSTALIPGGQSSPVAGVSNLPPGNYTFHCSLHPWMHGQLTILPAGGAGAPGPPPSGPPSAPSPPNPADFLPHVAPAPLGPTEWPFYGGDLASSRDGGSSAPSYNEVPTLGPVWSFESANGDFTGTPVVSGGTLVAGSYGGSVFALDAATGALRWRRELHQPIDASAAIANGRVFVPLATPGKPSIAAFRLSDGAPLWQATVDTQKDADVYGSPVVWSVPAGPAPRAHRRHRRHRRPRRRHHRAHAARRQAPPPAPRDTVYIGTSALYGELNDPNVTTRGSVVALDAATGAVRWKAYTVPPGHDGGAVWSTPAIDGATGRLFVGTGNAYHAPAASTTDSILALDARSGALVAHLQATSGDTWSVKGGPANGPDYDFGASPNLFTGPRGQALVGEGQKSGEYWAFDRSTLKPVWTANTGPGTPAVGGILGSTAYDGHRLYGPDTTGGELWALGTDGKLQWVSSDGGPLQFSAVSAGNGVVYTTDMSATLTAREATTGAVLAKLPIGGASWGGVALAGGSVFAVTGSQGASGWIVAYRPRG